MCSFNVTECTKAVAKPAGNLSDWQQLKRSVCTSELSVPNAILHCLGMFAASITRSYVTAGRHVLLRTVPYGLCVPDVQAHSAVTLTFIFFSSSERF